MSIDLLLTVAALLYFALAAFGIPSPRVSLVPLGLAFLTLTILV